MVEKYTEADLRAAFRAGWKERNKRPGLKRVIKKTMRNTFGGAIGMRGRDMDAEYVPDTKTYHNSIWTNSDYRKGLAND